MGYLVSINPNGKKFIIIGGGKAAVIKARSLNNADIVPYVISPIICEELNFLNIKPVLRPFLPSDLAGAFAVFPLTNDKELNREIKKSAHERNILVCGDDFNVPASRSGTNIDVSVSTGFPQLSIGLCEKVLSLDEQCGQLLKLRKNILNSDISENEKKRLLSEAAAKIYNSVFN